MVRENEIKDAIEELVDNYDLICEGAGAVGLAALKRYRTLVKEKNAVIIISRENLDLNDLKSLLY